MNRLIAGIVFALLVSLTGCRSALDFSEEDAMNHPWLFPFIDGYEIIEGKHYLSQGFIKLFIEVETVSEFWLYSDRIAENENWNPGYKSEITRVYVKDISIDQNREDIVILVFTYSKDTIIEVQIY